MSGAAANHSSKFKVWDSCRGEAHRLDAELEQKLAALEALGRGSNMSDSAAMSRFEREARDAGAALDRLSHLVSSLAELSAQMQEERDVEAANAAARTARFEEVVHDKRTALTRLTVEAHTRYDRAQLLSKVKTEIKEFDERADLRYATQEQDSISKATAGIESILTTQARSGEKLTMQRQMFESVGNKTVALADQIPFIRDVIKRIDAKRRRESVLLAILIGFLMFLVFLFW